MSIGCLLVREFGDTSANVLTRNRISLCSRPVESLRLNDRFAVEEPQRIERLHHTEAESTDWLVATGCPRRAKAVWAKEPERAVRP